MCQFISVVNIADVAEDKNSILARTRCCHLSDPVLSVRPGSKCPNTRRDIGHADVPRLCLLRKTNKISRIIGTKF